jgi:hypothetical protein
MDEDSILFVTIATLIGMCGCAAFCISYRYQDAERESLIDTV